MRILVTGSSGFIGSHVAALAAGAGHDVTHCDPAARTGPGDVRQLPGWRFDAVVHCAATVVSPAAKAGPQAAVAENLEIDAAFLRWAHATRPGRVVYFSSSCAYPAGYTRSGVMGPLRENWIRPGHPLWPDGLYGWAKLTGELLAAELAADGVPVTVVRPFSVYGPGMRPGFAVRSFASQAAAGGPVSVWGSGTQVRDYIHVTDVAAAVLAAVSTGYDGPVNLGTGRGTTLAALVQMIRPGAEIVLQPWMPEGPAHLVADTTRLRQFCEPAVTLEQGITRMLEDSCRM